MKYTEFWEYPDLFHTFVKVRRDTRQPRVGEPGDFDLSTWKGFYEAALQRGIVQGEWELMRQAYSELAWFNRGRPYYSVYPSVIPMLTRMSLDIHPKYLKLPFRSLAIRLPKTQNILTWEAAGETQRIRSILITQTLIGRVRKEKVLIEPKEMWESMLGMAYAEDRQHPRGLKEIPHPKCTELGITCWIDCGETYLGGPLHIFRNFPLDHVETLEQALNELEIHESINLGTVVPEKIVTDCVKLACAVGMLEDSPELIRPEVLTADQANYDRTKAWKYVDKAIRRGRFGFAVGADIEVCPHIRRPHLGLRWTGPGKLIPKIVAIKGSIVHSEMIRRVPTGYQDKAEGVV